MRMILLGPPGAGKGTQSVNLCRAFDMIHISTGDILRAAVREKTPIGQQVESILSQGQLVSDELILILLREKLKEVEAQGKGSLLDGFPRNISQAQALLEHGIPIDRVVQIVVPDDTIVARLSGRRVHPSSGRTYHISSHPAEIDDITGEPLVKRADDEPSVIRNRLAIYHRETEPLLAWYQAHKVPCHVISGLGSVEEVHHRIMESIKS